MVKILSPEEVQYTIQTMNDNHESLNGRLVEKTNKELYNSAVQHFGNWETALLKCLTAEK
jgi:hypothetical protein